MYVRKIIHRGVERYQVAHDYRTGEGKRREIIAHLGDIRDPEKAIAFWTEELEVLRRHEQHGRADKLERKLLKLQSALEEDKRKKQAKM